MLKSTANPVVAPLPSFTVTMQFNVSDTRTIFVPLAPPTQSMVDADVGIPYTVNADVLMLPPPTLKDIINADVACIGAFTVNKYVAPPSPLLKVSDPLPDDIVNPPKSTGSPVVKPLPSFTVTLHDKASPTRTIFVPLVIPLQSSVDADVGLPYTVKESPLPEIITPDAVGTEISNDPVAIEGALTLKVNV